MPGVELNVDSGLDSPKGWAEEAQGFTELIIAHPWISLLLFVGLLIVLVLIPGGIGPSWVKYRGAERQQEQRRLEDVNDITERISKRAQRRERGRLKGGRN
jgi:hypothetical protein